MSRKIADLEFVRRPQRVLRLDLFLPDKPAGPVPLAVWVYGGGWLSGDKVPCHAEYLTAHGFAAASIEYRYSQEAIFPAAVADCHAAICWLKARAGQYGIDADRIGLIGESAGGHLVALLGTSGHYVNWSGAADPADCGRVQAVVALCGPSLLARCAHPAVRQQFVDLAKVTDQFLGGPVAQRLAQARDASPLSYVHPGCPPFLILHGRKDNIVPIVESELLHQCLLDAGVDSTFAPFPDAGHALFSDRATAMVLDFFRRTLQA